MDSVRVCAGCGRIIEGRFLYCPWCALAQKSRAERNGIDAVFDQLETVWEKACAQKRLSRMEAQLDALEADLAAHSPDEGTGDQG